MVWQGPRLGSVAETGRFWCYGDALSTTFLLACLCALIPTFVFRSSFLFLICFFLHPGMFIFVSLRLCSSHLLLSASTYFIVRVLSACVICTPPHLGILRFFCSFSIFFRNSYFSGGVFFLLLCSRTWYASNLFAHLDSLANGFSLSHCDYQIRISLG